HVKPLVDGNNYNALQMQISEYVKFIGPTDVLYSSLKTLLQPGNDDNAKNNEKNKNEVEQTNKNYKRIRQKDQIDEKINELNNEIVNFYNAMKEYDKVLNNYFSQSRATDYDALGFALNEVTTYRGALKMVNTAYDDLMELARDIRTGMLQAEENENSDNASGNESDDDNNDDDTSEPVQPVQYGLSAELRERAEKVIHPKNGLLTDMPSENLDVLGELYNNPTVNGNLGRYLNKGQVVNYDFFKNHIDEFYIQTNKEVSEIDYSAFDVYKARYNVVNAAERFDSSLRQIQTDLRNLIKEMDNDIKYGSLSDEEKESTEKFMNQLKTDYAAILQMSDEAATGSAERGMWVIANFDYETFSTDFNIYAENAENTIKSDLQDAFTGSNFGLSGYDSYFSQMSEKINGFVNELLAENADINSILSDIDSWKLTISSTVDTMRNRIPDNSNYKILMTPFREYYKVFSENDKTAGGITYKEFYNTLKNWKTGEDDDDNSEKKKYEDLTDKIWDMIKEFSFDNIKLREGCNNKIMPNGAKTGDDSNSTKTDLKDILKDDDSGLGDPVDTGTEYLNKLMLMLYDYGMFTCQTSDKKDNGDNGVSIEPPIAYSGVCMAAESGGKYETSKTNFLLYGELEYIFKGNADPQKNMNAVRNSLAVIRFVPNYISTYTISEINSVINSVQSALAWCPLAAIIVAQALRIALASFETWCDLDLLYGGKSVLLYKNELGDLSFIEKLKDTETGREVYKDLGGDSAFGSGEKKPSISNLKVNYCQYLILLEMIFVSRDEMIKRTADLIEVNMNYVIKNGATVDGEDGKKTVDTSSFSLSKAYTGVRATVTVKRDFVFTGGVFNARNAGYDSAADLADEMNAEGNVYSYVITREY
ncbi:MAG: DUF5702 domain-containing protein, partial [Ruminococcus sp.]|nr:DUF5702 domain-containing protein [Ruminococcus sp.]